MKPSARVRFLISMATTAMFALVAIQFPADAVLRKIAPVPKITALTPTADGFTAKLINFNRAFSWEIKSKSILKFSISSSGVILAAGSKPQAKIIFQIFAKRAGYLTSSSALQTVTTSGSALIPILNSNADVGTTGISVQIDNFDPAYDWHISDSAGGQLNISKTGLISVHNLSPGEQDILTVGTSRPGFQDGSLKSPPIITLMNGLAPILSEPTSVTAHSFTIQIENFNSEYTWQVKESASGQISLSDSGVISVTNLPPSALDEVICTSSRVGYESLSKSMSGIQTLALGLLPKLAEPKINVTGYTIQISNYDQSFIWSGVDAAGGTVSIDANGLVSVTGLKAGQKSQLKISTTKVGFESLSSDSSSIVTTVPVPIIVNPPVVIPSLPVAPIPASISSPIISGHTIGNLIWSDEFAGSSGSAVNPAYWTARNCGQSDANGGGTCFNNESQAYLPSAVKADGQGNMVITASHITPAPGTCFGAVCNFTSGRFDTQGKVSIKYGYIEARIKMPQGQGNWPAFWMLSDAITVTHWPFSGEIDIAEQWEDNPKRTSGAAHYSTTPLPNPQHIYDFGENISGIDYSQNYHTYSIAWKADEISYYVDGILFLHETNGGIGNCGPGRAANSASPNCAAQTTQWPFNNFFFLIFNDAISDQSAGSNHYLNDWSTSSMSIDYVRVYTLDGQGAVLTH